MTRSSPISLDRRPIPDQIAHGLTELVLSGEMPPGEPLREGEIARSLGVSRNTVREAVRLLERSGLVRYEAHRGAVVREPSRSSVDDVYRARLAIELGAVSVTEPEALVAAPLEASLTALRAQLGEGDAAVIAADLVFHSAIVGLAGSERLSDAFAAIVNESQLYLTTLVARRQSVQFRPSLSEHEALVEAVAGGDMQQLVLLLTEHTRREAAWARDLSSE